MDPSWVTESLLLNLRIQYLTSDMTGMRVGMSEIGRNVTPASSDNAQKDLWYSRISDRRCYLLNMAWSQKRKTPRLLKICS